MDDEPSSRTCTAVRRVAVAALTTLLLAACGPADVAEPSDPASADAVASAPADTGSEATAAPESEPGPTDTTSAAAVDPGDDPATIDDLGAALVTAAGLPAPGGPFSWVVRRDGAARRPSVKLFDPCQPTSYPTDAQRTEVRVRDLRVEDDRGDAPETATLRQNIARYPGAEAATEAFDGYLQVAEQCADSSDADGSASSTEVVSASDDRLLLQRTPQIGLTTDYAVVERRGDVVTLVRYSPGETRDADARAQKIAGAVSAQLDAAG